MQTNIYKTKIVMQECH